MKSKINIGIACMGLNMIAPIASAEIMLNGFASVGGGFNDIQNGDGLNSNYSEDKFSADPINKIAIQSSAVLNSLVSVTGQLLAKGTEDYTVDAEWVYLTLSPDDNLDLRFGRLRSPLFIYSDYLDVGYAYPWISAPNLVYRFTFDTVEGMDALYRSSLGKWDTTYQVFYGRLTDEQELFGEELPIDIENFSGINFTLSKGWLTLRASYNIATFDIDTPQSNPGLNALFAGLSSPIGPFPAYPDVIEALEITDEKAAFYGVGAQIHYEDWIFNTEYTELNIDEQSFISDDKAWYAMLGKQIGSVLVHATYSKHEDEPDFSFTSGMSEMDPRRTGAESAVLNSETTQIKLGLRYDFADSTAFKVEVSQSDDDKSDRKANLVAFSIDTVF